MLALTATAYGAASLMALALSVRADDPWRAAFELSALGAAALAWVALDLMMQQEEV